MEKAEVQSLVPCEKIFSPCLHLLPLFSSPSGEFFSMAEASSIRDGSYYGSDVPTDFESELFCSTTSKTTDKSIPVAGRTRNVGTRQGEIARISRSVVSRRGRQSKMGNRGT